MIVSRGYSCGRCLQPGSVAVLGASPREGGHAGRLVANLDRTGYAGRVFPVNPKYEHIGQPPCYPSILDIEEPVDAAYMLLPAARVVEAVTQCVQIGVPGGRRLHVRLRRAGR